jgi:hypothetical protein
MKIILAHNHYDRDHLAAVAEEMKTLGAPVIKAVWLEAYGAWMALEGCHRIRAAHDAALAPEIDEVEYDADLNPQDLGLDYEDPTTIEQMCDTAHRREILEF